MTKHATDPGADAPVTTVTSYTPKFSSACSAAAPCIFDTNAGQVTGAVCTGIGLPAKPVADAAPIVGATYIGGAAQTVLAEITGDPNA